MEPYNTQQPPSPFQPTPQHHPVHEPAPLWQPAPPPPPAMPEVPSAPMPGPVGPSSAVEIVWQWVCYQLWQSSLFALSVFLSATLTYYFVHNSSSGDEFSMYSLAAVICLLPLAVIVDRIYRRREPAEKQGFAAVVLVLNALFVFFVLVCGLIASVVTIFWWLINGHISSGTTIALISSLVVTGLSGLLFARILQLRRIRPWLKWFPMVITGIVTVTAIFALAGPLRSLIATRDDRLIEDNIGTLNSAIQSYTTEKGKLPASLDDLTLNQSYQDGAKTLVKRHLVTYKNKTGSDTYTLPYTLCVTFKRAKGEKASYSTDNANYAKYAHGKGEQCYDETAYGKYDYNSDYNSNYDYNSQYQDLLDQYQTQAQ